MERLYFSLVLDLTDTAPEGAGWYLDFITDGTRLGKPIYVDPDIAERMAHAFYGALEGVPNPQKPPLYQLVQSGNQLIRQALEAQLKQAENQAARIAGLRQKLALAPPKPNTQNEE